jgi:hypothetical protein
VMFLVMSDDDRRIITEHGRNNIYQTFFPNGGVLGLIPERSSRAQSGGEDGTDPENSMKSREQALYVYVKHPNAGNSTATPSVPILAQPDSETRNVRVQTHPSRPLTRRKWVCVQALLRQ